MMIDASKFEYPAMISAEAEDTIEWLLANIDDYCWIYSGFQARLGRDAKLLKVFHFKYEQDAIMFALKFN